MIGVTIAFIIIGLLIGFKSKEYLIYIFVILYPFNYMPNLKYIDLSIFKVIFYLCTIPMAVILVIQFVQFIKDVKLLMLFVVFYGYFLSCISRSLHPNKDYIFIVVTSGIIVFLFTFYNFSFINMRIVNKISKCIIYFEALIVIIQQIGVKVQDILIMFNFNNSSMKIIKLDELSRATGTFADPNYFSLYIAVLIGSFFVTEKRRILIPMIVGIGAIVLSFSRMGLVLCSIILIYNLKSINYSKLGMLLLWSPIIVFLIVLFKDTSNNLILSNIFARFNSETSVLDASGRGDITEAFFKYMFKLPDLIWGYGFDNFRFVLKMHTGFEAAAHNQYIQFISDFGVIGIVLFGVIIFAIFKGYTKVRFCSKSESQIPIILILIGNLVLTTTFEIYIYFYFAIFCANYTINKYLPRTN